jgi:broad specificity phosphatase PhoE
MGEAKRRLILIKHARPQQVEGINPHLWELSDVGRVSCVTLAERLREWRPEVIVSSRETKAGQTAEIVSLALGVPWHVAEGLEEHDRSNVPIMRTGEFISSMAQFFRLRDALVLGDETAEEAEARIVAAVDKALAEHEGKSVAVVTHGTVLALYASARLGMDAFATWRKMGLPSFVVVEDGNLIRTVETIEAK